MTREERSRFRVLVIALERWLGGVDWAGISSADCGRRLGLRFVPGRVYSLVYLSWRWLTCVSCRSFAAPYTIIAHRRRGYK